MGKIIAINDLRRGLAPTGALAPASRLMTGQDRLDTLGRPLRDLRISVTDRCNFRCSYCMPKEVFDNQHVFLPQAALLSFEEITRLARLFADAGVPPARMTVVGHGDNIPVAPNDTVDGRARNRRVAVTILSALPDTTTEIR